MNVLKLIDLIGKCHEYNSNITSSLNIKIKKGLYHQFQISCSKYELSEIMETSNTLNNDKKVSSTILIFVQLLFFKKLQKDMLQ